MNILGESFPDEIIQQIKARQKVYGSGFSDDRTEEEILYLNSKTAWCKLASGTIINDLYLLNNPTIQELGYTGDSLARKFVLFNGTSEEFITDISSTEYKSETLPRFGITDNTSIDGGPLSNFAYGIGGTDFGIHPMMGIQRASIRHESRGSIRRAEIKIKAFNKYQFDIIDTLYLRVGFTVLLEWGHSAILNNDDSIDFNPSVVSLVDEFFVNDFTYNEFLNSIYEQRLATSGNYDAILGRVVNFSWSIMPDGSYDITVHLVSIGDVIESLKTNILTDSSGLPARKNSARVRGDDILEEDISGDIIDAYAFSHNIGNFIYLIKKCFDILTDGISIYAWAELTLNPSDPTEQANIESIIQDPDNGILQFDINIFDEGYRDALINTYDSLGGWNFSNFFAKDNTRYYVRLGTLLKFIEKYIIPKYHTNGGRITSAFKIDTGIETNLMNVFPLQVSVEPRKCFVQRNITFVDKNGTTNTYAFGNPNTKSPFINDSLTTFVNDPDIGYGNIMNIFLDSSFILGTINELKDDKGNLPLVEFLKRLLQGINEGLGGVNDFDIIIDETNNILRIIDKNPLNNIEKVIQYLNANNLPEVKQYNNDKPLNSAAITPDGILQMYGYWPAFNSREVNSTYNSMTYLKYRYDLAGFIKDFSLTSQLSPEFSMMITAGAAAQGTVVGENDTALSKLNRGLTDKFKAGISTDITPVTSLSDPNTLSQKQTEFNNMYNDYCIFLIKLSNGEASTPRRSDIRESDVDSFKSVFSSLVQKSIELNKLKSSINNTTTPEIYQGTGFLPFNLSLTMDGLSGMKIGQKFAMETSFLPSNYPNVLSFLIKNIVHEITNNRWETKLETYAIAKAFTVKQVDDDSTQSSTPQSSPPAADGPCGPVDISPNAERVISYLLNKGYSHAKAAGVLATLVGESGQSLNPEAINPTSGAYGIAQWLGRRKTRLVALPRYNTLDVQLDYLWEELEGRYTDTISKPYRIVATTAEQMLAAMATFERWSYPVNLYRRNGNSYNNVYSIMTREAINKTSPDGSFQARINYLNNKAKPYICNNYNVRL